MKTFFVIFLLSGLAARAAVPEFFVFDNGIGRGRWAPEQQAKTLKELGFAGISYNYTKPAQFAAQQKVFKEQGLKIFGLYVYTYLDRPEPFDPSFRDAIKLLKGTETIIWMTLMQPKEKGDHDAEAVRNVQKMADLAAAQGVRVAIYGHAGMYVATGADAARIAKLANRPNVGASINLCHEFLAHKGDALDATIKNVAPVSILVSVNGLDLANKKYLLRLDQGDFDVAAYLKKLFAAGYQGPVGLQCFSVPGDTSENLKADMAAWRKIAAKLAAP